MPRRRMKELLAHRALKNLVGRKDELEVLLECVTGEGPLVIYVHGFGGVGKSTLLQAFAVRARAEGTAVVAIDCGLMEPTKRGFLRELCVTIGGCGPVLEEIVERFEGLGPRVVLVLDSYEVFRLMDTWLRQAFIPALSDNARVILTGRESPTAAWFTSPEWQGLFRSIALGPLSDSEALELLRREGVSDDNAPRVQRFARGHPLALRLGASAAKERLDLEIDEEAGPRILCELTHLFLRDVENPVLRKALEAASVARRITQSLLGAMLPEVEPSRTYDEMQALPFVEETRDGLRIQDAVRESIEMAITASDPSRYREYRRSAWRQLRSEVQTAGLPELWRYTADMLHLIQNPVVREAFFPSGAQELVVEPARSGDREAILEISARHDGAEAARSLALWWSRQPQSFHAVRAHDGSLAGFYCAIQPEIADPTCLGKDPLTAGWWDHLQHERTSKSEKTLFLRRWLGSEEGEAPSPVQAACWLDVKRAYMELRPHLRRVYLTVVDLPTYAPVATELGFVPLSDRDVELSGTVFRSAMLDFGSQSVDGWLADLAAAELGIESETPLPLPHYHLEERIGSGGMGVVYRARDTLLERPVALKFLSTATLGKDHGRARFLREARTVAALNHPNICTIYEVGEIGPEVASLPEDPSDGLPEGTPFIAMEWIDGRSLRDLLDRHAPLPVDRIADLALQLAEGLAEAHRCGFAHRDLKPQNVMVTSDGQVKILDFGLAKAIGGLFAAAAGDAPTQTLEAQLTRAGAMIGTPAYMSPEQAQGLAIDQRSDIFSFGTMLYEMATGKHPFGAGSVEAVLARILTEAPEPLCKLRTDLPKAMALLTERCLAKEPRERPHDTREMVAELERMQVAVS
ncbi:MAG: protein kinase [Thermoanaerobaculia bacterium]